MSCVCHAFASVHCCLVDITWIKKLTSWLLLVMFILIFMWFCYFPICYPGTGVVLDCIDSWSLLCFLHLLPFFDDTLNKLEKASMTECVWTLIQSKSKIWVSKKIPGDCESRLFYDGHFAGVVCSLFDWAHRDTANSDCLWLMSPFLCFSQLFWFWFAFFSILNLSPMRA